MRRNMTRIVKGWQQALTHTHTLTDTHQHTPTYTNIQQHTTTTTTHTQPEALALKLWPKPTNQLLTQLQSVAASGYLPLQKHLVWLPTNQTTHQPPVPHGFSGSRGNHGSTNRSSPGPAPRPPPSPVSSAQVTARRRHGSGLSERREVAERAGGGLARREARGVGRRARGESGSWPWVKSPVSLQ